MMPDSSANVVHIVTVGTSLLTNCGWKPGQRVPPKKVLLGRLNAGDPRRLSAELNATLPFVERGACSRVHLLATDTGEGRLCRDVIASWFQSIGVQVTDASARGLLPGSLQATTDQREFNRGIRAFREVLFRATQRARKQSARVLLNATGGLKAETSVAVLVAAELGIPVYYLHESMPEPVFLPTAPVDPDVRGWLESVRGTGVIRAAGHKIDLDRLEYEGLIKLSRRQDGSPSSIRLTEYGRYWAGQGGQARPASAL